MIKLCWEIIIHIPDCDMIIHNYIVDSIKST